MKRNSNKYNFWKSKLFYRLVSLLIALLLVAYVGNLNNGNIHLSSGEQNSPLSAIKTKTLTVPVQLNIDSSEYYVSNYPKNVKVRLSGPISLVDAANNTRNFSVTANLRNMGIGNHRVNLDGEKFLSKGVKILEELNKMKEKQAFHVNGYLGLLIAILGGLVGLWLIYSGFRFGHLLSMVIGVVLVVLILVLSSSLTIIQPNEAKALTFFGNYIGTIRDAGLFMTVPFTDKEPVSLRVRNFNSQILKVNDSKGNPVEIAAVIVFKVVDTAKALFSVDDYEQFVQIQSESAIRHVASEYPYDTFENEDALTLRSNPTEVSDRLASELQERLNVAGVKIVETRLTHLAYATEIASAMLQKQQSSAILSARKIIVEGAVSITEDAIDRLAKEANLELTDEQRLQIINNIMVAIISERGTQPVINTGTQQ